ncbi:MAG: diaminopimelate epimerase [Bacteroidia bacterium]|nr:diaminopimelate epimerase [Bacteroidia bacterium]
MEFEFFKYQGTGNDFIIIDNRSLFFPKNDTKLIVQLCDRKFGIGADGLLLLEDHDTADFRMVYFNSDGKLSSMCGNGGRCIVHLARKLGIIQEFATFEAIDGTHEATIESDIVSLKMSDVNEVEISNNHVFLNTGSPHHVTMVDNLSDFDVYSEGKKIRNDLYGREGANINFVSPISKSAFAVRTYERGVEDETLSCGTGVTAVAIAMHAMVKTESQKIELRTPGGTLEVRFKKIDKGYQNVYLTGPATFVFKGHWK